MNSPSHVAFGVAATTAIGLDVGVSSATTAIGLDVGVSSATTSIGLDVGVSSTTSINGLDVGVSVVRGKHAAFSPTGASSQHSET